MEGKIKVMMQLMRSRSSSPHHIANKLCALNQVS